MTATVQLTLAGPLQSWGGAESRYRLRQTRMQPTKSGVLGMLAAALGRSREDSCEDLQALRFGTRTDQPGVIVPDFHTAIDADQGVIMPLSTREYLADSVFTVAVGGDEGLVEQLARAVREPVWPLYLGRRSCPPAGPIPVQVHSVGVEEVLRGAEWAAEGWYRRRQPETVDLSVTFDADGRRAVPGAGVETVRDQPVSWSRERRRYGLRDVVHTHVSVSNPDGRRRGPAVDWYAAVASTEEG